MTNSGNLQIINNCGWSTDPAIPDTISALPQLTPEQDSMLSLALNGEISMSSLISWARRTGQDAFAEYARTF